MWTTGCSNFVSPIFISCLGDVDLWVCFCVRCSVPWVCLLSFVTVSYGYQTHECQGSKPWPQLLFISFKIALMSSGLWVSNFPEHFSLSSGTKPASVCLRWGWGCESADHRRRADTSETTDEELARTVNKCSWVHRGSDRDELLSVGLTYMQILFLSEKRARGEGGESVDASTSCRSVRV